MAVQCTLLPKITKYDASDILDAGVNMYTPAPPRPAGDAPSDSPPLALAPLPTDNATSATAAAPVVADIVAATLIRRHLKYKYTAGHVRGRALNIYKCAHLYCDVWTRGTTGVSVTMWDLDRRRNGVPVGISRVTRRFNGAIRVEGPLDGVMCVVDRICVFIMHAHIQRAWMSRRNHPYDNAADIFYVNVAPAARTPHVPGCKMLLDSVFKWHVCATPDTADTAMVHTCTRSLVTIKAEGVNEEYYKATLKTKRVCPSLNTRAPPAASSSAARAHDVGGRDSESQRNPARTRAPALKHATPVGGAGTLRVGDGAAPLPPTTSGVSYGDSSSFFQGIEEILREYDAQYRAYHGIVDKKSYL